MYIDVALLPEVLLLSTGPISKFFVPINHLDTKRWENMVQVEKKRKFPFKVSILC